MRRSISENARKQGQFVANAPATKYFGTLVRILKKRGLKTGRIYQIDRLQKILK